MELSPPLATSPAASPPTSYCPSEPGTASSTSSPPSLGYPSPELVAQQYRLSSAFASPCAVTLEAMNHHDWAQQHSAAAAQAAMPSIMSTEYDGFGNFGTSDHHNHHHYSVYATLPGGHPSPQPSRSPAQQVASRHGSLSYAPAPPPPTPRIKLEAPASPLDFGQAVIEAAAAVSHYPSPRSMLAYAGAAGDCYGGSSGYLSDTQSSAWSRDYHSGAEPHLQQHSNPSPYTLGSNAGASAATPQPTTTLAERRATQKQQQPQQQPRKKRLTTRDEANFQCEVKGCGKLFSRSYNYKAHLETHDEKREYPFPCGVALCGKRFVRKTDLARHNQSVHMKERNHKCDYCGRMFARKDTLRRHMEDGCSKRFDIGTLDVAVATADYEPRTTMAPAALSLLSPPAHTSLRPLIIPPPLGSSSSNSISQMHPLRQRDVLHGNDRGLGPQHWGR